MNVAKLNPIGYEAKTEKGNTYKKSNLYKTLGALSLGTTSVLAYTSKNQIVKSLTTASILDTIESLAKTKVSPKLKPFVLGLCAVVDIAGGAWLGSILDNYLSKNRAQKADAAAEEASKVQTQA